MIAARTTRRLERWLVGILAMVLTGLLAPAGIAHADPGVPVPPTTGLTDTGAGTVTAADIDFVVRVRLAGLWEIPASNMAIDKSDDPKIVAVGKSIAAQHVILDKLDREAAKKLNIQLPNQPNSDQLGWLGEMKSATTPAQFDDIYVERLRAAHGKIFPAIATIRASTRNDTVRKLAQEANQFVATHMTLLESSGIVDYGALPTAPAPVTTPTTVQKGPVPVNGNMLAAAATGGGGPGVSTSLILLVLAAALAAGVFTTMRIFRSR
jgi:predicted outer membrane protein